MQADHKTWPHLLSRNFLTVFFPSHSPVCGVQVFSFPLDFLHPRPVTLETSANKANVQQAPTHPHDK